jgi:hypothetical protein
MSGIEFKWTSAIFIARLFNVLNFCIFINNELIAVQKLKHLDFYKNISF